MRTYVNEITVDGIPVEVHFKRVKYLRIVVYRSSGRVRISSPHGVPKNEIYSFLRSKKGWIKKQLGKSLENELQPQELHQDNTTHYLWGEPFTLRVDESAARWGVREGRDGEIILSVKPGSSEEDKEKVMREWYRDHIKQKIPGLIRKWEPVMGLRVKDWGVKKMKTRWGTCNVRAGRIWLGLDLAKLPPEFLEYITVHEMTHLLERLHSPRFYKLMDEYLPGWRQTDKKLGGKHWKK